MYIERTGIIEKEIIKASPLCCATKNLSVYHSCAGTKFRRSFSLEAQVPTQGLNIFFATRDLTFLQERMLFTQLSFIYSSSRSDTIKKARSGQQEKQVPQEARARMEGKDE